MAQVRQSYTNSDLGRAQQEAMARVRQMQDRARQGPPSGAPAFRNWSTDPNIRRREQPPNQEPEPQISHPPPPPEPPEPPPYTPPPPVQEPQEDPAPPPHHNNRRQSSSGGRQAGGGMGAEQTRQPPPRSNRQSGGGPAPSVDPGPEKPKDTTLLQDILGGVGLDDDRILILGLILILINDKADTTLILALLYLLL